MSRVGVGVRGTGAALRGWLLCAAVFFTCGIGTAQASDALDSVFSEVERAIIKRYADRLGVDAASESSSQAGKKAKRGKGHSKGKGKQKSMPPGLAKRSQLPPGLAKRETLPPGLQREPLPQDLSASLPPPRPGTERVLVDGRAVLIEAATNKVLDVLEDVLIRRF